MKTLLTLLYFFTPFLTFAQLEKDVLETGADSFNEILNEATFDDELASTFIFDNTKTKIGRDLYEIFYHELSSAQLDSVSKRQLKLSMEANPELVIEIEEIPSPGLNNVMTVKVDGVTVWQEFVQARIDALAFQAAEAVKQVIQYYISFQDVQNQLGSQDQSGSGIY
ncbi:curli production assembly/transport protein CsgE [Dyadobacter sp. CY326]|uniref:curli production assembly/transport protein CsgE n=1 Tax=Dyadobacter sp. CY326 TaxID=2907300 RepID=UPI001F2A22AA|nr:curli production assembly/transport protein CsgE [Dyadobacter sp. CY326]MCE7065094.1 curli production assembly/transport protein CsgE [Dyadobacter sp. CY326]